MTAKCATERRKNNYTDVELGITGLGRSPEGKHLGEFRAAHTQSTKCCCLGEQLVSQNGRKAYIKGISRGHLVLFQKARPPRAGCPGSF